MRVLVTGGAGYIGSHAAGALKRAGHEPVIFDNFSTGHRFLAADYECIEADIGDRGAMKAALRNIGAVMHFAGLSTVGESCQHPRKYMANNLSAGLAMLDCVLDAGVSNFIFSSTCAVYGLPAVVPIADNTARIPGNPYGTTKLAFEHALEAYHAAYGLRYLSLRYFNAAGADEAGLAGECHSPESHLIPVALEAAAGFRPTIDIYGNDYPTPDGTCIRDYVHVSDLALAHLMGLNYLVHGGSPRAFNLGTGRGHSVMEVLATVEKVTQARVNKNICPRRQGDPPILVADARQARERLGWEPTRTLEDMIRTGWNWMQTKSRFSQPSAEIQLPQAS
jgi:UDP-glucose-4-epimerase GalE